MRRTDKICNNDTRIIHLPQLFFAGRQGYMYNISYRVNLLFVVVWMGARHIEGSHAPRARAHQHSINASNLGAGMRLWERPGVRGRIGCFFFTTLRGSFYLLLFSWGALTYFYIFLICLPFKVTYLRPLFPPSPYTTCFREVAFIHSRLFC